MSRFLSLALGLIALASLSGAGQAQGTYPSRPVRIVVPFAAGGTTDFFARLVADRLSQSLGRQFIVENRGGAGGIVGVDAVAKAQPDGYMLAVGTTGTHAINPSLYARIPYDPLTDYEPVAYLAGVPNLMVVNPKTVTATTVAAFVEAAKASRQKFSVASSGVGTSIHLTAEMFKRVTGIEMPHVPYRGSGPAVNDLLGGQVDVMFDNLPSSLEHVRAGNLRALAVVSSSRSPVLPDVPTLEEGGVAGVEAANWFALFAPKGTPTEITGKLNAEIVRILASPDIVKRFAEIGGETRPMKPAELMAYVRAEQEKWSGVVKSSGARIE